MNTKTFAQQSRNILLEGVSKKLMYWGFDEKGNASVEPVSISGGYTFRGDVFDDPSVPGLWRSLQHAIQTKGIDVVLEEAAYTWFNRIMALRILAKNGYEEPQLENARGLEHTPLILQRARQGQMSFLSADEQSRLRNIIGDYTKDQEAFAILLKGYCHSHRTLQRVFGRIDDYTELLLPDNMLQNDGFLHLLNTTDAISDEEYQEVELIGWLYQFYISEKKDEVFKSFKKNKKAEAKDIPAATQIFTPNWIVKYMVENTAGKIWLDHHPNSDLKSQMKYLVTNGEEQESSRAESRDLINSVEELTLMDPACGSGHILVEGFHLLYQMYMEEYYTPEEAVESILKNNLYGLDIDDRAAQLANFAVLLKAAKVYPGIWQKDWLPNVYAMPEANPFSEQEVRDFLGEGGLQHIEEVQKALDLMQDAKNLGSIMQFDLSDEAVELIKQRFKEVSNSTYRDFNIETIYNKLQASIPPLLALNQKYKSVVANPPYMGNGNMNQSLKNYLEVFYPNSKSDLMTVFMESSIGMLIKAGYNGLINLPSWMHLKSFTKLRKDLLQNKTFNSVLDFGRGVFGSDFGSVAYTLKNETSNSKSTFVKLFDHKNKISDIKAIESRFFQMENIFSLSQKSFLGLPNNVISYWASEKVLKIYEKNNPLVDYISYTGTLHKTAKNEKYLRQVWEVDKTSVGVKNKWVFYNKGGKFRRWFGNNDLIVDWSKEAIEHYRRHKSANLTNRDFWFRTGVTWTALTKSPISGRFFEERHISDYKGASIYPDIINVFDIICYINSKVGNHLINVIAPTLDYNIGQVIRAPYIKFLSNNEIIAKINIDISRRDWNSKEISYDFEHSQLLNKAYNLGSAFNKWAQNAKVDFFQLHANEEELNRIFIDIYGLQEELTPEVALKDITILQEELDRNVLEALEPTFREQGAAAVELPIDKGEVISQFISYAIGLFMGRYRLDKPGLHIAHPNPSQEEVAPYQYNGQTITIDEDAILPIMGTGCNFKDDALQQIYSLLDTIWGPETRTENLNFIQECLNKDLEKFLVKDFYKYHCGMYKMKPIYWLFASPKGAFQVLVYMHRMNAFTVEKIRDNYLLEHIKNLEGEISLLESNELNLNTQDRKKLEQLRKDLIECQEYEVELKDMADKQITFDLDDGVTENYKLFEGVVAKIK